MIIPDMPATEWQSRFKGWGRKMTMPRRVILDVLSQTRDHLSAEEVYFRVHRVQPSCGLTTVYRTLELLSRMRVLVKHCFGAGRRRYEFEQAHGDKRHHHHLVCKKCKRVVDFDESEQEGIRFPKRVEEGLSRKYKFRVEEHEVFFMGLCSKCRKSRGAGDG